MKKDKKTDGVQCERCGKNEATIIFYDYEDFEHFVCDKCAKKSWDELCDISASCCSATLRD